MRAVLLAAALGLAAAEAPGGSCAAADTVDFLQREASLTLSSSASIGRHGTHAAERAGAAGGTASETLAGPAPSCARDWQQFGSEPLVRTQVVAQEPGAQPAPSDFRGFKQYPDHFWFDWTMQPIVPWAAAVGTDPDGLVILPDRKLAMCLIPKVASSEWNIILAKVALGDTSMNDKTLAIAPGMVPKLTLQSMTEVFSDPAATRVVFIREPLARLKSAFTDKCNNTVTNPATCPMAGGGDGTVFSMKDAVEWALSHDLSSPGIDKHWLLQSAICELRTRVKEYTVVGLYSKDRLSQDAACIMKMAGIEEFDSQGPSTNDAAFWKVPTVQGQDMATPGVAAESDAAELMQLRKLFTPAAARKLIKHLAADYETFNLPPEPEWVASATGELYETPLSAIRL